METSASFEAWSGPSSCSTFVYSAHPLCLFSCVPGLFPALAVPVFLVGLVPVDIMRYATSPQPGDFEKGRLIYLSFRFFLENWKHTSAKAAG